MAITQSDITAIETAINNIIAAGGAQEVTTSDGKTTRYYSLDELRKVLSAYTQAYASSTTNKLPFQMFNTKPKGTH